VQLPRLSDPTRRALITVLILGSIAGIFFTGMYAVTGTDATSSNLPDSVERLIPPSGAEALRQSQVGIDVADGYDATLQLNGVDLRDAEDGLIRDLGTGFIRFQPGEGRPVEELNQGTNCVVAFVWREIEDPSTATPVSWCFEAT
jgi:hypothetical protein